VVEIKGHNDDKLCDGTTVDENRTVKSDGDIRASVKHVWKIVSDAAYLSL
jgi:hypothetical protein